MPNLPRTSRCAVSSALLLALAMTVAQTVTAQTAPAALQPSESHHTVATLSATGVQIYVCKRDGERRGEGGHDPHALRTAGGAGQASR
ncbi:MAG: hypothetical protein AAFW48_11125, partial [Pseudomonadota bacterium]